MLRGFYTAASGMIAQQRQQESLANNIANVNTPGYKADQATMRAFPEMLIQQMGSEKIPTTKGINIPGNHPIGSINTGVYVQEMVPNFDQGDIRETGVSTDIALVNSTLPDETGGLFFTLQNEQGDLRYTRNGNFTIDGQGFLTSNEGLYVLDEAGNSIQTNGLDFTVGLDGVIDIAGGNIPLGISYTDDVYNLAKEGNDLFSGEAVAAPVGIAYTTQQGVLEQSNVDSLKAMTDMMEAYRVFETNQRVLKAYDESMGKTVSEIGRL